MASLLTSPPRIYCGKRFELNDKIGSKRRINWKIQACPFGDEPILREALKEPVAFLGGVFAGLLRLDLNEDPLKEWISKTVEASGIKGEIESGEDSNGQNGEDDDTPQQILIE